MKEVTAYIDKCKVEGCSWTELQMTTEDVERMMKLHVSVAHKDTSTVP